MAEIILYIRKQPVLIYVNPEGETIVRELADHSKGSIKKCISLILNIPKKYIALRKNNNAWSDEYCRQLDYNLGFLTK